jgi:hypothetical protein
MAKMNWDRVRREDRARKYGTEPAWVGLPGSSAGKKKKKKSGSSPAPVRSTAKKPAQPKVTKRTGLGQIQPKAGYDDALREIVTAKRGWMSITQVAAELQSMGITRVDSTPLDASNVLTRLKARRNLYQVEGNRVRLRPPSHTRGSLRRKKPARRRPSR